MAAVNIRDTGRNSARTVDVRELATKVQKPSDTEAITAANTITAAESGTRFVMNTATARIQTLPFSSSRIRVLVLCWSNRAYKFTYNSHSIKC